MKKHHVKWLSVILSLIFIFICSSFAMASSPQIAPDEESADHTVSLSAEDGISIIPPLVDMPPITNGDLIIVLDPGHGANDSGTLTVDGSYECTLNMVVAKYLKSYLEQYDNVTVYLTHEEKYNYNKQTLDRVERAAVAASHGADIVISLHFNAVGGTGSVMLLSVLEEYRLTGLGEAISAELSALGIKYNAPYLRKSENEEYWTDNIRLADYYGMIRQPLYYEIPSLIIEHCFVDNSSDYYNFASSDAKLKALAEADGRAIVSYFGLKETPSATTLENTRYTALQKLNNQYLSMDLLNYNAYHRGKIVQVYDEAKKRIEIANNIGKIDLTVNRAVKTLQNYPTLGPNETTFYDVKKNEWFYPAVTYCVENKLFYGTTDSTFSPYGQITRGQFIAVLGRLAGVAETTPTQTKFSDVNPNQYYAPHILWATEQHIVAGIDENRYGPDQNIRREDLLRMLHSYCTTNNIELPSISTKTIHDFADGNKVDSWAIADVNWALEKGIIVGYNDNTINPTGSTSRAEVAQIMMSFQKSILALEK